MINLGVLEQLLNHISQNSLCKTTDKILLAVSGGLDSMVMLHLLRKAGFSVGVAHANFGLRGEASDQDEAFVRETCEQMDLPFFARKFDTREEAAARGLSIQMAARDQRYAFFAEIAAGHGYTWIATAHHFGDLIESVFLNLIRGTGIDGFRGIAVKKGNIIRPMLFATRSSIRQYAETEGIRWREDATNATDDYPRNYVRHQVIPRFLELNPGFEEGFRETHQRMLGARAFSQSFIDSFRSAAVTYTAGGMIVDMDALQQAPFPAVLLWEIVKPYGFHFDHCKQIVQEHQPGKRFQSNTHEVVVDRKTYILTPIRADAFAPVEIHSSVGSAEQSGVTLRLEVCERHNFKLRKDSGIAQLDADRLSFPLVWRKWEAGDYFVPLGMHVEKKLSDFLIDLKIPFNSKADVTVLESNGDIVWVVGYRIHERYKVTPDTQRVLVVQKFP